MSEIGVLRQNERANGISGDKDFPEVIGTALSEWRTIHSEAVGRCRTVPVVAPIPAGAKRCSHQESRIRARKHLAE